jgi:hypothetical protein
MGLIRNLSIFAGTIIFANSALGNENCVDLGHIRQWSPTAPPFYYKMKDCSAFIVEQYVDGNPVGNQFEILFQQEWKEDHVDDEYEKFNSKHRWFWNPEKTELIHEAIIDGCNKKSGACAFTSLSESFRKLDTGVELTKNELKRKTSIEGKSETSTSRTQEVYPIVP